MKTKISVNLNRLICKKESDGLGGSEPYIWPFILTYDGTILKQSPQPISNARIIIRDGMRANETSQVPFPVNKFIFEVPDITKLEAIILVVTLMEEDQTGDPAIKKGFEAYEQKLAEKLDLGTLAAVKILQEFGDKIKLDELIKTINNDVKAAVKAAVKSADHWFNLLDPDDSIDSAFISFTSSKIAEVVIPIKAQDFTLSFKNTINVASNLPTGPRIIEIVKDNYLIEGSLSLINVADVPLCQVETTAVINAQALINSLEFQIDNLQNQLDGASPNQKPSIIRRIGFLEAKIPSAEANLARAQRALDICRAS